MIPEDFEEAWAVINRAFGGWPPSEMDAMPVEDFCRWFELAKKTLEDRAEQQSAMFKAIFGTG